jgi:hypothetical protein
MILELIQGQTTVSLLQWPHKNSTYTE